MDLSRKLLSAVLITLFFSPVLRAEEKGVYRDNGQYGYYWYEKKQETPDKEDGPDASENAGPAIPPEYTYEELWNMHPDRFQEHFDAVHKRAVQTAGEEDILRFIKLKDIATRKSRAFASVYTLVSQKHGRYALDDTWPITAPGRQARVKMAQEEYDDLLARSKHDFALIVFVRRTCGFCTAQESILDHFQARYGWEIKYVDMDDDPEFAALFGIERSPSMILVKRGMEEHMPVSVGVISLENLKQRLFRTIRYMNGQVQPEQLPLFDYEMGSGHDPLRFIEKTGK